MLEGHPLKTLLLAAAALPAPVLAQDHSVHGTHPPAEPEVDHAAMDHSHDLLPAVEASENVHDRPFRASKLQAGYAYTLPLGEVAALSLGGSVAKFFKPAALDAAYGDDPTGYTLFAKLTLGR